MEHGGGGHYVQVRECYRGFMPPVDAVVIVGRLLSSVPQKYLPGLGSVVLTNASGLNRKRRRDKLKSGRRNEPLRGCRGTYHHPANGQAAHIELFVDNILHFGELDEIMGHAGVSHAVNRITKRLLKTCLALDLAFSKTLYHEIGHHIHETQAPEFIDGETAADNWSKKLRRRYLLRTYWYIMPLLWALRPVNRWLMGIVSRSS